MSDSDSDSDSDDFMSNAGGRYAALPKPSLSNLVVDDEIEANSGAEEEEEDDDDDEADDDENEEG